jgi:hypothetical protein
VSTPYQQAIQMWTGGSGGHAFRLSGYGRPLGYLADGGEGFGGWIDDDQGGHSLFSSSQANTGSLTVQVQSGWVNTTAERIIFTVTNTVATAVEFSLGFEWNSRWPQTVDIAAEDQAALAFETYEDGVNWTLVARTVKDIVVDSLDVAPVGVWEVGYWKATWSGKTVPALDYISLTTAIVVRPPGKAGGGTPGGKNTGGSLGPGPIAGIVGGGLVVAAGAGFAVWWFVLRKKSIEDDTAPAGDEPQQVPPPAEAQQAVPPPPAQAEQSAPQPQPPAQAEPEAADGGEDPFFRDD